MCIRDRTYIPEKGVLLSCDAFGGYSIPPFIFDDELEDLETYLTSARKYFANVISKYGDYVVRAIGKLKALGLKPRVIAPSHGVIWRKDPARIVDEYLKWSKGEANSRKATLIYSSMYGEVKELVEHFSALLIEKGLEVKSFGYTDVDHPEMSDVLGEILDSSLLVLATPAYESGIFPEMRELIQILKTKGITGKEAVVLSSYGWAPVAGRRMRELLEEAGFRVIGIIEFQGRPKEIHFEKSRELAERLVKAPRRVEGFHPST